MDAPDDLGSKVEMYLNELWNDELTREFFDEDRLMVFGEISRRGPQYEVFTLPAPSGKVAVPIAKIRRLLGQTLGIRAALSNTGEDEDDVILVLYATLIIMNQRLEISEDMLEKATMELDAVKSQADD